MIALIERAYSFDERNFFSFYTLQFLVLFPQEGIS